MCTYKYKIKFYDEIYEKDSIKKGIVFAENYTEAMSELIDFYGEDETINISIKYLDELPIYEF